MWVNESACAVRTLRPLYPGVKVNTSATDYHPIGQFVMIRFDGKEWVPFTDLLTED